MLEAVYKQLGELVVNVLDDVKISSEPPSENTKEQTVHIYLKDIEQSDVFGRNTTGSKQLVLVFWITITGSQAFKNNEDIIVLMFSFMNKSCFELEPGVMSASDWISFGMKPQPSFFLKVALSQKDDSENITELVREPLVIQTRQK